MTHVRISTFNVENLFARWRFKEGIDPSLANKRGWIVDDTLFSELGVDDKAITGAAVRSDKADLIGFQEVENVDTLKNFRARSLGGRAEYPHVAGVDGNDPRRIDVAVLSRSPITRIRSYQHLADPDTPTSALFSRDCLEVDVQVTERTMLTLFVNHFKSMMGGRAATRSRRMRQAAAVQRIVTARFGANPGAHPFIIMGDLNDYLESDDQGDSGITELVEWDQVDNAINRLPEDERWTHFWAKGNKYRQLDYLLLSRSLADANAAKPEILHKGLPLRATRYTGERFPGVGQDRPKASDHCPVTMTLDVV
ncbi:endonuclease/exonuclease/phosphatase [Saccharopolyspora karakumensis]|uniref:Endonuclease/exonuclease/phosphatase n=1 Tax=Saccharopolyspora karakumensis TaxID=2530386 RepID=A0A4R5BQL3_9PSEU|nr:endonuclease/exonuclease/phosphatase family protein [Saccharopolyspora karakumensis]TDD89231.1 endonuclease/exonuclease/phosphatase [Saccharopolyspora karakumensis]